MICAWEGHVTGSSDVGESFYLPVPCHGPVVSGGDDALHLLQEHHYLSFLGQTRPTQLILLILLTQLTLHQSRVRTRYYRLKLALVVLELE